jgi:hypothetical protein
MEIETEGLGDDQDHQQEENDLEPAVDRHDLS